jgi:CRP-like cAMP-binding protein
MHQETPPPQSSYEILKNSSLFGGLSEAVLRAMIDECTPGRWKKAEVIDPDLSTHYLHILLSGRLKVTQVDPSTGRSVAMFLLSATDIFDIFSFLDGKEHLVQPIALDTVEYLRIPLARAREWVKEHPEFNETFLPYLGEQMRDLEAFGESLVFHDTTTRLANLILKHAKQCDEMKSDHYPVSLINNLSHEALAEMIGSVRSVVSTQMHKLKEEGAIISKRGHLAIANLEKLVKKCDRLAD